MVKGGKNSSQEHGFPLILYNPQIPPCSQYVQKHLDRSGEGTRNGSQKYANGNSAEITENGGRQNYVKV
jgi:hypothetical protein